MCTLLAMEMLLPSALSTRLPAAVVDERETTRDDESVHVDVGPHFRAFAAGGARKQLAAYKVERETMDAFVVLVEFVTHEVSVHRPGRGRMPGLLLRLRQPSSEAC